MAKNAEAKPDIKKAWLFISAVHEVAQTGKDTFTIPCAICDELFSSNTSVETWDTQAWQIIDAWIEEGQPQ